MFECQQGNQGNLSEYGDRVTRPARVGPGVTDEADEWRSRRSSPRLGKPATWQRAAGCFVLDSRKVQPSGGFSMNVEVVQKRLWEQSQQHRKHMHHPQRIAAGCDRVLKRSRCQEMFGKPDAWKLARPVWGWGRGAIPGLHLDGHRSPVLANRFSRRQNNRIRIVTHIPAIVR